MRRLPFLLLGLTGCMCPQPLPPVDAGVDAGEDPGSLSFTLEPMGAVLRGDAAERTGTFKNTSAQAVEVTQLTVTGVAFSLLGLSSFTVPAGGEATLQVRFAPPSLGSHLGELTFLAPTLIQSRSLQGLGIGPALALSPSMLDLGTVPLYAGAPGTASASLDVRNSGLDTAAPRPDPTLQVLFDVQSTSDALPEELCVGDCTGAPVRLAVDQGSTEAVTLTTTTAGLKTWDVRVFSNDPDQPMRTVPVTANVVARPLCQFAVPAGLSFGVLTAPEQRDLEFVFENVGTEVCEVNAVDLGPETPAQSPPFFSLVNPPAGLQTIAPGELLRVTVRASAQGTVPQFRMEVAGEVRLEVNHPDRFARVPLTAQSGLTCLVVTPSPVDFATVQTGCRSADRTVTLRNRCSSPVMVTAAALPGFSAFSVSAQVPTSLAAGASMTLTTRYAPVTVGPARDVINLNWGGPNGVSLTTISLLGEASVSGQNTDSFGPRSTRLDVLLALADSSGMVDKEARLRAQLPGLVTALQNSNVDFRIGVITATPTGGALRRTTTGARWITSSMPALQTRFGELITITGDEGTAAACEEPVLRALAPPYAGDPQLNGGFLRPDALLSVLCVTDTSDVALRVGELLRVKAPGAVRVDVIGPVAPSTAQCSTAWVSSLTGHLTYTQTTGGQVLDVCAADWTPVLVEVAGQTATRAFFPLRAAPDLSGTPMEVRVATLNVTGWTYESVPNAVLFPPLSAPLGTSTVEISYPVPCAP